jgi:hypothetical protein
MRAFYEDPTDILALKIVALALGAVFMLAGIGLAVTDAAIVGLPLLLMGCYIAAGSLIGLRDGQDGWRVFAPAGMAACAALAGMVLAIGAHPAMG